MEFDIKALNLRLTDNDLDEFNYFLSNNSSGEYFNEVTGKWEQMKILRDIVKVANAKQGKIHVANQAFIEKLQLEHKELQQVHAATKSELQAVNEANERLKKSIETSEGTIVNLTKDIQNRVHKEDYEAKLKLLNEAQTEIQRLKNEIKDNELAPNEFIISLSNSQRRCIVYETRQKHFVEKTALLAKDKGTQVKAVTKDDNENIANFFWNYYYYSKKFSNGVLPIDELINAHNKYDK